MMLYQSAREQAAAARQLTPIYSDDGLESLIRLAGIFNAVVHVYPMKDKYSGVLLKKNEHAAPEIYINSKEPLPRQRFTLAHEIGHLVERTVVAGDPDFSFVDLRSGEGYDLHEFFADEFAGALLMPADDLNQTIGERGLAGAVARFGVSVPAIQKRLARLEKHPEAAA